MEGLLAAFKDWVGQWVMVVGRKKQTWVIKHCKGFKLGKLARVDHISDFLQTWCQCE